MFVPPMQPIFSSDEDAALARRAESAMEALEAHAERMRLRDTFAAAALTGLLTNGDYSVESTPVLAWRMADAMLRERERTNHDAAPAAKATADRYVRRAAADGESARTDKAAPRRSEGTGDTPVTEPLPEEKRADVSYQQYDAKRDTTQPRNGTPAEGSVGISQSAIEPVAWAAGDLENRMIEVHETKQDAKDATIEAAMGIACQEWEVFAIYRHPQATLTDAERDAVERAANFSEGAAGYCKDSAIAKVAMDHAATLRGLLERMSASASNR